MEENVQKKKELKDLCDWNPKGMFHQKFISSNQALIHQYKKN
jgi:hypothetical protein